MATASMANRKQQSSQGQSPQTPGQQGQQAKFKPTTNNPATNDRAENKPSWGRKNVSAGGGLVNRAVTPQMGGNQRTNSPTPAGNAWTTKADERASHDQFTHLLYTLTSQSILLHTRGGNAFTGILTSFDFQPPQNELALVLSHVLPHPLPDPSPTPKKNFVVLPKEIISISATSVSLGPTTIAPSTFRTDTAISGTTTSSQRPLERWQPDPAPTGTAMQGSLDQSGSGGWDQFATNERMFGLKSNYSEEIYTTKLDRTAPDFQKRYRQAENIAREIEGKVSSNPHLQEERNQKVDDSGMDEEDKYSGVLRPGNAPAGANSSSASVPAATTTPLAYAAAAAGNKYTPPAKRVETRVQPESRPVEQRSQPIDPAIISSKLRTDQNPSTTSTPEPTQTKPALPLPSAPNGTRDNTPREIPVPIVKEPEDATITPQIQEVGQKFVKEEKVKIKRARNLIGTKEKARQFAEFAQFSSSLTLNMPVPTDLLPILAGKDANKQKAILERNQELKRKADEKKAEEAKSPKSVAGSAGAVSPLVSPAIVSSSPVVASPISSPAPTLTERLKAHQNRAPGTIPSPIASPTPLDVGVVKPLTAAPKKLDPSAKEFVFKVSAKEFKPSFTPSTHSPSPSRSSIVSPPPARSTQEKVPAQPGFWDKKPRKEGKRESVLDLNTFVAKEGEKPAADVTIKAYTTHPAWPTHETDDPKATGKGYLEVFVEGKSLPPTPTPGQDEASSSGHSYSRSSSVHPVHHTPQHLPQQLPTQPPALQTFPQGPMYPPAGAVFNPQYGYMIPQSQVPLHPQQAVQQGFTPQLLPTQYPQAHQSSPYNRFQQQGYQSVSPSPMMQHAIPAQYGQQPQYATNGQFQQGFQPQPMYQTVPPYTFIPQGQQNGGYSGHPSPGRAAQAMVYNPMPPMNMIYQDNMMRQPYPPQQQNHSLRTPPQPYIPPHQNNYQHSPSRNNSYASAGHPTPSHSRRQSTQPPPTEDEAGK